MKKFVAVILAVMLAVQLAACKTKSEPVAEDISRMAEEILSKLTTEQKIGQLFCVSFSGTELSDEVKDFFEEYSVGNVILFSKNLENAEQTAALCRDIQSEITKNTGTAAFIGTDQEGGRVTRVTDGAVYYPGAMAAAACGSPEIIQRLGENMGSELRALGINIDFAPVADVNSNPDNPVIGTRSFGDRAENAAEYASTFVNGMNISGEVSTAKHYPGHGDTDTDSHYGLPMVDKSLDALMENELVPFKKLIENNVPAIMAAHILYPQIDPNVPASMSHIMLTDVLRNELGFEGMIVTDSMRMGAVTDYFGGAAASVAAIKAGADMIITGTGGEDEDLSFAPQAECIEAVREAVYSSEISGEVLDDAVLRIIRCKLEYDADGCGFSPLDSAVLAEHQGFSEEISRKSITVVKDENNLIPVNESERVLMIAPEGGIEDAFKSKINADIEIINDDDINMEKYREMAEQYDKVIVCASKSAHVEIINAAAAVNPNTIAVSLGSPYLLRNLGGCTALLCAYEYTQSSAEAVVAVLAGETDATGILPVNL